VVSSLARDLVSSTTAACLTVMTADSAEKPVYEMPESSAIRIYNLLVPAKQDELFAYFSEKTRSRIRRNQMYAAESAGALPYPRFLPLYETLTVREVLHRIRKFKPCVHSYYGGCQSGRTCLGATGNWH